MRRNKLPAVVSLEYLINEVRKQEQKEKLNKEINYVNYAYKLQQTVDKKI